MTSIFKKVLHEERVTLIAILDQEFTLRYLSCIEELFQFEGLSYLILTTKDSEIHQSIEASRSAYKEEQKNYQQEESKTSEHRQPEAKEAPAQKLSENEVCLKVIEEFNIENRNYLILNTNFSAETLTLMKPKLLSMSSLGTIKS